MIFFAGLLTCNGNKPVQMHMNETPLTNNNKTIFNENHRI